METKWALFVVTCRQLVLKTLETRGYHRWPWLPVWFELEPAGHMWLFQMTQVDSWQHLTLSSVRDIYGFQESLEAQLLLLCFKNKGVLICEDKLLEITFERALSLPQAHLLQLGTTCLGALRMDEGCSVGRRAVCVLRPCEQGVRCSRNITNCTD